MTSIALALTRDYLRRSLWPALAALGYLVGLPLLGYLLIVWQGTPVDAFNTFIAVRLPFGVLLVSLFGFMLAVWMGQGQDAFGMAPRLYVLPLTTWFAVGCRMLQCGLTVAALCLLTLGAYNRLFGTSWPLWAPAALLVPAAWWFQAATWTLRDFRLWKLAAAAGVLVSLGYWIALHSAPDALGLPGQSWIGQAPAEALVWLVYSATAIAVSLEGVARHRRGDSVGPGAWLERRLLGIESFLRQRRSGFADPEEALCWLEWTRRGLVLPVGMAGMHLLGLVVGAAYVALGWSRPIDVLEFQVVLGLALQPQLGLLIGMFQGHRSQTSSRLEFDSFSATRPVSDRTLARAFLRMAWRAVAVSYAVTAAACLIAAAWAYGEQRAALVRLLESHFIWSSLGGWSVPLVFAASLLAAWAAMGLSASLVLSGRSSLLGWVIGTAVVTLIGTVIVINLFLPPPVAAVWIAACAGALGLAILIGTVWAFLAARRWRLISTAGIWQSAVTWLVLCAAAAFVGFGMHHAATSTPPTPTLRWLALPLIPGLLALCVAPLATAPLALAWNRHR
jgi:hypothetical protein